jgi:hypothetical protein
MAKNDLLKEAIADAKAVRETALANAKIALEEDSHLEFNQCYLQNFLKKKVKK